MVLLVSWEWQDWKGSWKRESETWQPEIIGEGVSSVAVEAPGLKGSWRKVETWYTICRGQSPWWEPRTGCWWRCSLVALATALWRGRDCGMTTKGTPAAVAWSQPEPMRLQCVLCMVDAGRGSCLSPAEPRKAWVKTALLWSGCDCALVCPSWSKKALSLLLILKESTVEKLWFILKRVNF